jgi:hypothetical protein
MGLMDKVKAQASQLAQQAQDTAREGKARLDQAQANKHADGLMRNLGALVYAERTSRGTPETEGQINKLIGEISAHEAEHGINLAAQPVGWIPPAGASGTAGASGASSASGSPGGTGSAPFADPESSAFPQSGAPDAGFPPSGDAPGGAGSTAFPQSDPTPSPESSDPTSFPESGSGSAFPPPAPPSS